jgi:peroxiredoxin
MKMIVTLAILVLPRIVFAGSEKPSPIGKKIDDFKLRDYRGADRSLHEFADKKLTVVAFLGTECPLAKLYGPRLAELAREFEPKGVAFLGINANQQDSISAISNYAKQHGIVFPILKDVGNVVADNFGAVRTPEVFVLDAKRVVRYWGRIDDQYGIGYARPKAVRRDLATALDELLSGKAVGTSVTEAQGCFIGRVQQQTKRDTITYTKHIAPILHKHCVACHHEGEVAPFSLTNYDETIGWTETIREVVDAGRMPPWHADPKYGKFSNDRRLAPPDRQLVLDWIKNGAPQGDLKDLAKFPEPIHGWRIPKPDVVLKLPKPRQIPATGTIPYQYVVVETGFTEDKWVKAAEVVPGCRSVVHHVLVFVQAPDGTANEGLASHWLASAVPGDEPMLLPDGLAKKVPAGSRLLFQIHYTTNGSPQTDQTSLGLVFADPKTVKQEVSTEMVINERLRIPPNAENHREEATRNIRQDSYIWSYMPHTHLRGKAFKYEAIYPDGKTETLLDVPRYDFNWQNTYLLAEPKFVPKGTKLHCVTYYDNSKNNLSNPNPNTTVHWGDQTWQEMMIGYFNMTVAAQDLLKNPPTIKKLIQHEVDIEPALKKLAQQALDSQKDFESFAAALHKELPKLDRLCVTTYKNDNLKVEHSAYPGTVTSKFAETGFERRAEGFMLAYYALFNRFAAFADLKKGQGADLQTMSKTLSSSVHVPVAVDGAPATVNFWSKEKDAFSKETQELLKSIAKAVSSRK